MDAQQMMYIPNCIFQPGQYLAVINTNRNTVEHILIPSVDQPHIFTCFPENPNVFLQGQSILDQSNFIVVPIEQASVENYLLPNFISDNNRIQVLNDQQNLNMSSQVSTLNDNVFHLTYDGIVAEALAGESNNLDTYQMFPNSTPAFNMFSNGMNTIEGVTIQQNNTKVDKGVNTDETYANYFQSFTEVQNDVEYNFEPVDIPEVQILATLDDGEDYREAFE